MVNVETMKDCREMWNTSLKFDGSIKRLWCAFSIHKVIFYCSEESKNTWMNKIKGKKKISLYTLTPGTPANNPEYSDNTKMWLLVVNYAENTD